MKANLESDKKNLFRRVEQNGDYSIVFGLCGDIKIIETKTDRLIFFIDDCRMIGDELTEKIIKNVIESRA